MTQQKQEPVAKPMTAHRAVYFMERFKKEEKLLGPNEQAALDFVIAMLEQAQKQEPVDTVEQARKGCGNCSLQYCDYPDCLKRKTK